MNSAAISSAEFQVRSNERPLTARFAAACRQRTGGRGTPAPVRGFHGGRQDALPVAAAPRSAGACQGRRRGRQNAGALRGGGDHPHAGDARHGGCEGPCGGPGGEARRDEARSLCRERGRAL